MLFRSVAKAQADIARSQADIAHAGALAHKAEAELFAAKASAARAQAELPKAQAELELATLDHTRLVARTGYVYDRSGHIVTADHVVDGVRVLPFGAFCREIGIP